MTFDVPGGHQFDPATRRFVLSHDTRLVAIADATMFAAFDTSTGQPLFSPLTALAPVEMMEFSPDNSAVAVVTKQVAVDISEPVTILDTASGQALFRQTFSRPDLVSFSPAGGAFVVTGLKGDPPEFSFFIDTLSAPDIAHHGGLLVSTHELEDPVTAVELADAAGSTALAVTAGQQQAVTFFEASTGEFVRDRSVPGVVTTLGLSPGADYFVIASSDKTLRAYDLTGEVSWRANHTDSVNAAAISPRTGSLIATGAGVGDKNARLFTRDLRPGEDRDNHQPLWTSPQSSPVTRIAISADDQFVATGCRDKTTRLLDAATGTIRKAFPHDDQVSKVVFSPTAPLLATANKDGTVLLIDAATNTVIHQIGHPTSVTAAAFSSDGSLLATATAEPDNTVRIWRPSSPDQPVHVNTETSPIHAIAFSPTQSRLAITPAAGPVVIIAPATGNDRQLLAGSHAETIAYSPDGQLLITASENTATVFSTNFT